MMFKHLGKNEKGGAMLECALVFPIVLLLTFGIIQLALIGNAMSILNDAAQAAARAASVGRNHQLAASYVCLPLIRQGMPPIPIVRIERTSIGSGSNRVDIVTARVTYNLKVMYPRAFGTGFGLLPFRPLTTTCRMPAEPTLP